MRAHASRFGDLDFAGLQAFVEREEFSGVVGGGGDHRKDGEIAVANGRQDFVIGGGRLLQRPAAARRRPESPQSDSNKNPRNAVPLHGILRERSDTATVERILVFRDARASLAGEEREFRSSLHRKKWIASPMTANR